MGGADERAPVLAVADEAPLPRAGVVRRVGGSSVVRDGDEGGTNEGGRTLGGGAAPAPVCPGSVGRAASGGGPCAAAGRAAGCGFALVVGGG